MSKEQIANWVTHPITKELIQIIEQHSKYNKQEILEYVLNKTAVDAAGCMPTILQLKGQVHVLDAIANIKEFLLDALEEKGEEEDEEIQSNGAKDFNKSP